MLARIYGHALRLRLRGARYYPHPGDGEARRMSAREATARAAEPRRAPPAPAAAAARPCSPAGSCCACSRAPAAASCSSSRTARGCASARSSPSARCARSCACARRASTAQLLRGSIGLCESYIDGLWDCDDLVALTRIPALNVGALDRLRRLLAPAADPRAALAALARTQHPGRSRRRIEAHYDLGNELFALFLDETMMYSCAVFERALGDARAGVAGEARAGLPEARPGPRGSPARDRHRLGRARRPRRLALRLPRDDDDDLARTARLRERARARGRARGPRDGAARGLPRPRAAATTSSSRSR